jgi:hypothetical protein
MSATLSTYTLQWDSYSYFAPNNDTETGGIYSQKVKIYAVGGYTFEVEFRVGEGRTLGILFCKVTTIDDFNNVSELNYSFGEFNTNTGAMLFAQFALDRFIDTEKWDVCPSFEPVDYIDGEPYTLAGDEIVSTIMSGY